MTRTYLWRAWRACRSIPQLYWVVEVQYLIGCIELWSRQAQVVVDSVTRGVRVPLPTRFAAMVSDNPKGLNRGVKITPANAGWRAQFRFRGSHHRPGVAEFHRSAQ